MKFTKENVYRLFTKYRKDGISLNDLQDEILKLDDTPEKVVVPKFVADWIEDCKSRGLGLSDLLNYWTSSVIPTEVIDFIEYDFTKIGCGHKEQELLAKAWLDGYEVEKEPLYEVIIAGRHLLKLFHGRIDHEFAEKTELCAWAKAAYQLTEQEIKAIDERYIPFMIPVDEVNND